MQLVQDRLCQLILLHTATIGLRVRRCAKYFLTPGSSTAQTPWGPVRIKTAEGFGVSFLYAAVVGDDPRFGRFSCPPLTGAHELNAVFLKHTDAGALARRFLGRTEG